MKQEELRPAVSALMVCARSFIVCALLCTLGMPGAQAFAPDIYPPPAQAESDVKLALAQAAATHKHVILDFGGNWCPDCHVLDGYFHDPTNKPLLDADYVLVHVNIGHMDENLAIAERYQIPLKKGVPALAVLNDKGVLLYSQKTGEFEAMRHMQSSAVTEFLMHWKGG
jgi:thiol:disulfide interchange protein